ncbi:hypothetical protein C5167_018207 [Papaver somniferum]|uniref:Uncharacterized protein n=1 Tax=Papaver somniferum TaxID=3469 RepID=A0A4Y7IM30_PAPSO|nr:hypothetical protein C5167_018207 [Papaver somniferum]
MTPSPENAGRDGAAVDLKQEKMLIPNFSETRGCGEREFDEGCGEREFDEAHETRADGDDGGVGYVCGVPREKNATRAPTKTTETKTITNTITPYARRDFGVTVGSPASQFSQPAHRLKSYDFLSEKFQGKLAGWKRIFLTHANKLILIKAVPGLMRPHFMSTSILPKGILKKLSRIMRNFWWGHTYNSRKIHFIN